FERRFYDPALHGVNLRAIVQLRSDELLNTTDFLGAMNGVLAETRACPVDFLHETDRKAPLWRLAKATFHAANGAGSGWVFQDVLIDGAAHKAGVQSGAALLGINGH